MGGVTRGCDHSMKGFFRVEKYPREGLLNRGVAGRSGY